MTWFCTPPGTSKEYGQTMPIRTAGRPQAGRRSRSRLPTSSQSRLQHVPVLRVPGDALGERVGEPLGDQPDPHVEGALVGTAARSAPAHAARPSSVNHRSTA